ncbi:MULTISPECIES: M20 family metallopeptidase [unclassified Paenibacillus]|uniref:M20 family metallopeptidase n=1 Tax=unclassified Paenibacillus TaxID=185978 RepID=UPI0024055C26|nr:MULTISPECIES: M20 family metallopeptidase [unclassified Paenibacillus]MDF9839403.1 glutamate carboxypeptidase [Paenibacillus sp. PastF-2]MDF9845983.1 glutamate carboxypeptidase [Paenibacillus sp. PastM-2]MDF9852556.1 glutamate carboxypeptidase [Paenibacillus sp. PastF-1]MDH6477714.1 glutamate carboxypeptidase [Paenibacillus sp. PastH-2]MDH6505453.1 glutamate carboxypeptidase [Paenibacillus sp. PastM-3]
MSDILDYLKEKQDNMLATLQYIVEHESPTLDKLSVDALGVQLVRIFEELTGGRTAVIANETYGDHIRGEWGEGEEQILLLAHFDTVWKKGDWPQPLIAVEQDILSGPGVFDMKGGLVQGIYAIHALHALGKKLKSRIVFLFTSDEELGSPTSRKLIEEEAQQSKYVLVLEPSIARTNAVKTSRKGVGMFRLEVVGNASHAGADHQAGKSAVEELARQITYLHSLTDYSLGTTVNVGVISGGSTINVVAAKAAADIDLRVTSQAEADRVIPLIMGIQPVTEGTQIVVTGGMNRPPMERTAEVGSMYEIARVIALEELNFELAEGATGGASDGNFAAPLAPTIDGLGAVGDGAHAANEHLVISQMPVRSALVAHLIEKLDEMKGDTGHGRRKQERLGAGAAE